MRVLGWGGGRTGHVEGLGGNVCLHIRRRDERVCPRDEQVLERKTYHDPKHHLLDPEGRLTRNP